MATIGENAKDDKDVMIENNDTAKDDDDFDVDTTSKDRFGFFVSDKFHRCSNISMEISTSRKMVELRRSKKWIKMMSKWKKYTDGPKSTKMKNRVRKGIPDDMRGFAWYHFAHTESVEHKYPDPYKIDTSVLSDIVKDEIERDIDRTFPSHVIFADSNGSGQHSLRNLLRWYASLDPEAGYCQGMGFVAGLFLTYMVEEQAFYTFYSVLTRPSAPLRLMYLPRLAETQKVLYIFEHLGKLHLGRLWDHLETEGIHPTMYFIEWAMTMFCRGFSFELVTRVWDIFLFEGDYKIVYRVSLAILKNFEKDLLTMKFEKILPFMREFPTCMDAVKVMDLCWTIPLRREEIARFETEYLARNNKK